MTSRWAATTSRLAALASASWLAAAIAIAPIAMAQDVSATPAPGTAAATLPPAQGDDEPAPRGVYARITVDRIELRSEAGAAFRAVWTGHRGDVFPLLDRGTRGFWYGVELPDGTRAWVPGNAVYVYELAPGESGRGILDEIFAPPPLPRATGELAIVGGAFNVWRPPTSGFLAVRPTLYIAPEFGIEGTLGVSVGEGGRLFLGTIGGIVNIAPTWVIVPFFVAGAGAVFSDPNADTFLLESGALGAAYAGGGLRFGFRYRFTIRIEVRAWSFFDENRYAASEELSGGITVFF